jgi:hypothetical protein
MEARWAILGCALCLSCAAARADVELECDLTDFAQDALIVSQASSPSSVCRAGNCDRGSLLSLGGGFQGFWQAQASPEPATGHAGAFRSLPPTPSSLSLFLVAVGGMGAWQFGRSAKKLRFGHLPDWLHTGGPAQVAHATALGPDLTTVLPAAFHDQPVDEPDPLCLMRSYLLTTCEPQLLLPATEPARGPPSIL